MKISDGRPELPQNVIGNIATFVGSWCFLEIGWESRIGLTADWPRLSCGPKLELAPEQQDAVNRRCLICVAVPHSRGYELCRTCNDWLWIKSFEEPSNMGGLDEQALLLLDCTDQERKAHKAHEKREKKEYQMLIKMEAELEEDENRLEEEANRLEEEEDYWREEHRLYR
jgi:hypothetical protein